MQRDDAECQIPVGDGDEADPPQLFRKRLLVGNSRKTTTAGPALGVPPPPAKGYVLSINRHDGAASSICSSEGNVTVLKEFTDGEAEYPSSLKLEWRGARLTAFVDSVEVANVRDTAYATGRIGVDMFKAGGTGDTAAIDRIVIRPRDEPVPGGRGAVAGIDAR